MRAFLPCLVATCLAGSLVSCAASGSGTGDLLVVGSFYPLAWAAEQVGGRVADVVDLTPPGVEAHDTILSARQVSQVQGAGVVLLLDSLGFQPQIEAAADNAHGVVVDVMKGIELRPSQEKGLSADPHVWLDPVLMEHIVRNASAGMVHADARDRSVFDRGTRITVRRLEALDAAYRSGLRDCRFTTFVTTHEAFGYLADEYGLDQVSIEGLTPEAEPSANQLRTAEAAIRDGRAAPAVFYEGTADGERIGRSVAAAVKVPPLPLGTLEFDPAPGTYLSVMRDNLENLEKGLQCR
jgi:zinc transport system substrate-binding protein